MIYTQFSTGLLLTFNGLQTAEKEYPAPEMYNLESFLSYQSPSDDLLTSCI